MICGDDAKSITIVNDEEEKCTHNHEAGDVMAIRRLSRMIARRLSNPEPKQREHDLPR